MTELQTTRWDVVDHLDSEAAIIGYLEAVFEDGDPRLITAALDDVARARGIAPDRRIAAGSDVRSSVQAMKALGLELTAKAA